MLQQLTAKPAAMLDEHWEFLLSLPFGAIAFPDVPEGKRPSAASLSKQDLDGRQYFVCWDAEVLAHLNASQESLESMHGMHFGLGTAATHAVSERAGNGSPSEAMVNKRWLEDAQLIMSDGVSIWDHQMLAGILHKLAEKATDLPEDEFVRDEDFSALAHACEHAMNYWKRGDQVKLPMHLHGMVPRRLQKHLCQ
jgi:hypothetical protein